MLVILVLIALVQTGLLVLIVQHLRRPVPVSLPFHAESAPVHHVHSEPVMTVLSMPAPAMNGEAIVACDVCEKPLSTGAIRTHDGRWCCGDHKVEASRA